MKHRMLFTFDVIPCCCCNQPNYYADTIPYDIYDLPESVQDMLEDRIWEAREMAGFND